jgi:intracellular sulfur oxidation DsrE/DsrF family protein
MQVRNLIFASSMLAAIAVGGAPIAAAADASSVKNRVVIQVSDYDQKVWNLALNNARNLQQALGEENVEIEIVVYGAGAIGMLKKDSPVAKRISDARDKKVTVVACETTMKGMHLTYDDMLPTVGFVPGGIVEIMQKQQQGWSYIRP